MLKATPGRGRTRWILIPCAWTIVGLLFTVQEIAVAKVHGGHVSWVLVGVIELVYWNVWAAYVPLRGTKPLRLLVKTSLPPGTGQGPVL